MNSDQLEQDYLRLYELSRDLGMPVPPAIHYSVRSFDHEDNEIFCYRQRAHSFVRNYYNYVYCSFTNVNGGTGEGNSWGAGGLKVKNTSGTQDYVAGGDSQYYMSYYSTANVGIGDTTTHIVVGSSTAAFNFEDYALGTKINHGTTAGTLLYQTGGNFTEGSYDTPSKTWSGLVYRDFNNNSGGDVTVNEIGFVGRCSTFTTHNYLLFWRDVLPSPVVLVHGSRLRVTYSFSLAFPA